MVQLRDFFRGLRNRKRICTPFLLAYFAVNYSSNFKIQFKNVIFTVLIDTTEKKHHMNALEHSIGTLYELYTAAEENKIPACIC